MKTHMFAAVAALTGLLVYSAHAQTENQQSPGSKQTSTATSTETSTAQQPGTTAQEVRVRPHLGPKWENLPKAVQNTAKEQAMGESISDIDKQTREGKLVYQIEFAEKGKNRKIQVAEDGSLIHEAAGAQPSKGTNRPDQTVPVVP